MSARLVSNLLAAASAVLVSTLLSPPAAAAEFTLLIYETQADFAKRTDQQDAPAYWKAFGDYAEALKAAGVLRGGMPLMASERASVVRVKNGKPAVTPSAYAKTREHLGGFFMIEVADKEAALAWAAKAPAALTGAIEVRPAFPAPPMR